MVGANRSAGRLCQAVADAQNGGGAAVGMPGRGPDTQASLQQLCDAPMQISVNAAPQPILWTTHAARV